MISSDITRRLSYQGFKPKSSCNDKRWSKGRFGKTNMHDLMSYLELALGVCPEDDFWLTMLAKYL